MASLRRPLLCQLLLALAVSVPTSVRAAGFDGPTATTPAGTFNGESPAAAAAAHSMSAPCAHTADAVARRSRRCFDIGCLRCAGILEDGTNKWLGIPYAEPPIGDLRWRKSTSSKPRDTLACVFFQLGTVGRLRWHAGAG